MLLAVLVAALTALALAPAAEAALPSACNRATPVDATHGTLTVASADGAVIVGTLFVPNVATLATPVPVVLQTHGAGGSRALLAPRPGSLTLALLQAGYAVLNWDTRGHGDSRRDTSGAATVRWTFGGADREGADVGALLAALASCRVIQRDGPGDPRAGFVGPSNGGAIQLTAAGLYPSIDAIVPEQAWGDLAGDLHPAGVAKELILPLHGSLVRSGVARDPAIDRWRDEVAADAVTDGTLAWLRARSTVPAAAALVAPTLLIQGSADTVFGLGDALRTRALVAARGVPAKLVAVCRPHGGQALPPGACPAAALDLNPLVLRWLDRHLKQLPVDTGAAIEWQDQLGETHSASALPPSTPVELDDPGTLRGTSAASGGDQVAYAAPAPAAEAALRAAALAPGDGCRVLLGTPRLTLAGTVAGGPGHAFAELVDVAPDGSARTLGSQTTPIALPDGELAVEAELAAVAWRLRPGHRLELELTSGSGFHREPASDFVAALARATLALPVGAC
jgi:ABC-2 type transport system ATP-binding protein